ncbi:hypothetical protein Esi_0045_0062 [Ectocarpus siliculosus]|uniref:Uncharacterized protein n=1 Tax=Ectocarpus siliculosus TaxID=2880 RepID=D7G1I3_ECTSI|nr:hypothetical protein Esi_0045_0062 [Ectocarpus siliculosus]|eukprot:CBJ26791.1 hypothetical protein Esi_0045_0062 [Ectocarpus siliculosus]
MNVSVRCEFRILLACASEGHNPTIYQRLVGVREYYTSWMLGGSVATCARAVWFCPKDYPP